MGQVEHPGGNLAQIIVLVSRHNGIEAFVQHVMVFAFPNSTHPTSRASHNSRRLNPKLTVKADSAGIYGELRSRKSRISSIDIRSPTRSELDFP